MIPFIDSSRIGKNQSLVLETSIMTPSEKRGERREEHKRDFWKANNYVFPNPGKVVAELFTL